jgi:polyisoprenoid-binding protein YceI
VSTLSEQVVSIPGTGTYHLDPSRSSITFVTRHMFGLGKVTGTFSLTGGELVVNEPVASSTATARAAANSFATGSKQRDKQVTSKTFLDAANHPDISFRSTDVIRHDRGWTVRGRLTVRANTAPVDFLITQSTINGPEVSIRAAARVDRYAHQITKMKGMAARYLDLDLRAEFRQV